MEQGKITAKGNVGIKSTNINKGFNVRHIVIANDKEQLKKYSADTHVASKNSVNNEINFYINTALNEMPDVENAEIMKRSEFFNMHHYDVINFIGHNAARSKKAYSLYGDLSINSVSRRIKLDVGFSGIKEDANGSRNPVFSISGKIYRKDWGLNWDCALTANGLSVHDKLQISCEVQLTNDQLSYYYSFFYSIYSAQCNHIIQRKSYFMGG